MKQSAIFTFALLAAAGVQASCYTVLGPKGQILSESPNAPVDMSYQLHQTVPYKYGTGATMVFGIADQTCGEPVDTYYDVKSITQVVYNDKSKAKKRPTKRSRAARRK